MVDINKRLKDAAYVAVGFGVLGFQKAQVRRQELTKQIKQIKDQRGQLTGLVRTIDDRMAPVRQEIEGRLDQFEDRLPSQAQELVKRARTLTTDTEVRVRKLVGAS